MDTRGIRPGGGNQDEKTEIAHLGREGVTRQDNAQRPGSGTGLLSLFVARTVRMLRQELSGDGISPVPIIQRGHSFHYFIKVGDPENQHLRLLPVRRQLWHR